MVGKRKYAPEVYECIKILHKNNYKPKQIQALIKMESGLDISYYIITSVIYKTSQEKYQQKPEVKARQRKYLKDYRQKSKIKTKIRKYHRNYYQKPKIKARRKLKTKIYKNLTLYVMEVFDSDKLTAREIRLKIMEKYNVNFTKVLEDRIDKEIANFEKRFDAGNSPIIRVRPYEYKLNLESPYWKICDGFAEQ